jgi:hypothetical protein
MSELELEQQTNIKFLVNLGNIGSEIREMLMKVYGDNTMKKTAVHKWVAQVFFFFKGREVSLTKRGQGSQQRAELKKTLQKLIKLCVKIVG